REALLGLEAEGYVIHTKNLGAVVKKFSVKTVKETYELLALLESYATEVAAGKISEKEILYLKSLNESFVNLKKNTIAGSVKLNLEFHNFVVKKCGNVSLQQVHSDLRKSIYRVITEGATLPTHIERYACSHDEIIKAINERDAVMAGNLM